MNGSVSVWFDALQIGDITFGDDGFDDWPGT
jgi:hypothetical protein